MVAHLTQQRRQTPVKTVYFELGAPDVGGDLDQPPLLWQGVEVVHLLVPDVPEVVRLVPTPTSSPSSPEPWTVEGRGFLHVGVVGVRGYV